MRTTSTFKKCFGDPYASGVVKKLLCKASRILTINYFYHKASGRCRININVQRRNLGSTPLVLVSNNVLSPDFHHWIFYDNLELSLSTTVAVLHIKCQNTCIRYKFRTWTWNLLPLRVYISSNRFSFLRSGVCQQHIAPRQYLNNHLFCRKWKFWKQL